MSVCPGAVFTGEYDGSAQEDMTGLQAQHCVDVSSKNKLRGLEWRPQP